MEQARPKTWEELQADKCVQMLILEGLKRAAQDANKAKKKALRILIPAVVVASLILLGLGIVIGKFLL